MARNRALLAAIIAVLGLVLLVQGPHDVSSADRRADLRAAGDARRVPAVRVTVRLALHGPTMPIPRSFLGFSTEYWTLPVDEAHAALYRRAIALLHARGDAPFVLRIGGVSSDHSLWQTAVRRMPEWAFAVTPRWVTRTAGIVRQSRLRVIIDLNLITATPALDAALAHETMTEFPRASIAAFEIGNEPDVYNRTVWGDRVTGDSIALGLLPRALSADTYARIFAADARSLSTVAPKVPLQGPALADPHRSQNWVSRLLSARPPRLDAVSIHEYPYTECARAGGAAYPTIAKLLSLRATASLADAVRPAVRIARRFSMPVRVSEFNSVTCGGVSGVSNAFATALWAPSALFTFIRAGVSSADLHVRAFSVNAPFGFDRSGAVPRPLLYGLVLFTRMVGPGSHLVPVRVHSQRGAQVRVWAVRQRGHRLGVLVIDPMARAVKLDLRVPTQRPATVQRLLAPSPRATSGETLDGQRLGADLRWHGRRRVAIVAPHDGHFAVTVAPSSADLISVPAPTGARA